MGQLDQFAKETFAEETAIVYGVGPSPFLFLWIAANELPLADELVPFLIARSGPGAMPARTRSGAMPCSVPSR